MAEERDLSLWPASEIDQAFLFELYRSTRAPEAIALGLDGAALETFMKLQFAARNRGYRAAFPTSEQAIVHLRGRAVGVLWVDREASSMRVVDITIRADLRGSGLGTLLLRMLQREASERGCPLFLHVVKSSRAASLYARLGFVAVDALAAGPHVELTWQPRVTAPRSDVKGPAQVRS